MSEQIIGTNAEEVTKRRKLLPISKVTVICGTDDDGNEIVREAGDDTGRTFEVQLPILVGDPTLAQRVADSLLAKLGGYEYQPFEARTAILDPLAELGDAVTVGDVYSVLASSEITFDVIAPSDISAPAENAVDHEFPYTITQNREIKRRIANAEASIRINAGEIEMRVKDATGLGTSLTITANGAAFSDENGGVVEINGGTLKAGTVEADYVVAGIEISAPTITGGSFYGAEYWNSNKTHWLEMGVDLGGRNFEALNLKSTTKPNQSFAPYQDKILSIYDGIYSTVGIMFKGIEFLSSDANYQAKTMHAYNRWQFEGPIVLSEDCYGDTLPTPTSADVGRLFFLVS